MEEVLDDLTWRTLKKKKRETKVGFHSIYAFDLENPKRESFNPVVKLQDKAMVY